MKSTNIIATLALVLSAASINAQTITGFGTGANVSLQGATFATATAGATSFQVIGVEGNEVNFSISPVADASLNATRNLVLTGTFTFTTNPGSSFGLELTDDQFEAQAFSGSWSSFTTSGVPASVILTRGANNPAFNGSVALIAFTTSGAGGALNFVFDELALVPVVIPEPSSYAVIAGIAVLGLVAQRRRRNAVVAA